LEIPGPDGKHASLQAFIRRIVGEGRGLGKVPSAPKTNGLAINSESAFAQAENCQIGKSGGGKQLIRGFVQVLISAMRIRQMSNQFSGKLVNIDASQVVKLLSLEIEDGRAEDDRDADALAVEDVSVHRTRSYFAFTFSPCGVIWLVFGAF
jgi:hypothetical protein